jgi:uncharacterized membrane protein
MFVGMLMIYFQSFSPVGTEQPSRNKKNKKKDKNKDKSISKASKKEKKSSKRSFDEEDELLAAIMDADEPRTEKKKTSNVDNNDESDSEEERWLTAIEAGKLDEVRALFHHCYQIPSFLFLIFIKKLDAISCA